MWVAWVLANSLGFALGTLALPLPGGLGFLGRLPSTERIISGFVIGGFAAIMQWLVLRRWTTLRPAWWTLAGAAGGAAGYTVGVIAFALMEGSRALERTVGGAVGGATIGLIQWFFLRRQGARVGLWVPANSLGYAIAVPFAWDLWPHVPVPGFLLYDVQAYGAQALSHAAMGAVAAAITGLALAFILKLERSTQ